MERRYAAASGIAAMLACGSLSAPARADGGNARAAERLFLEGRQLDAKGRFAEACARYEQSETLDPAVGTLLNLGSCAERQGRTATALHRYREAAALASRHADAPREALATRAAENLASRQASLVVRARGPVAPGVVIHRNDDPVAVSELGRAIAVDPGTYTVRVETPGQPAWSKTVTVAAGPTTMTVDLPEPAPVAAPPSPTPALPVQEPTVASPPEAAAPSGRTALTPVAIAAGIAGAAAIGVGAYFGLHAHSQWNTVTQVCRSGHCPSAATAASEEPLDASAERNGNIGTGLLIGGGVALAAGVVLFLVDGRTRSSVEVSASGGGAAGTWRF